MDQTKLSYMTTVWRMLGEWKENGSDKEQLKHLGKVQKSPEA